MLNQDLVSIRAPAWGATVVNDHGDRIVIVSIRAPAWGATKGKQWVIRTGARFNSRSRMGSDLRATSCQH